jgi:hypothetical protein
LSDWSSDFEIDFVEVKIQIFDKLFKVSKKKKKKKKKNKNKKKIHRLKIELKLTQVSI